MNKPNIFQRSALFFAFILLSFNILAQQTSITGSIKDETGEPLAGVNVIVKGKVIGTTTKIDGTFSLTVNDNPPFVLSISMIGFKTQEVEVTEDGANFDLEMSEDITTLGEIIVTSATRVEENIMQSPVSIEKMGIMDVRNTASDDYYKAISGMKGVDMTASSINFQIVNARGFGSTGNTRFVQLTDGMDTQAPALNFPIGNLNGPSQIDVESVELIPGAASALYGPNAFNGILMVTSKSPFEYQGLSAYVKVGANHFGGDVNLGEPDSPQPMFEGAIRYAQSFNDKFAFKVNISYMQAEDWYGSNFSDKNAALQGDLLVNPAYDGVNMYGDDGSVNLGLLRSVPSIRQQLIDGVSASTGLPSFVVDNYVDALPADNVNRTGYKEYGIVDYGAENLKGNLGLNYRINDNLELSYFGNYGGGTSVYTGAQRYSLVNFSIQQHKLMLDADNFNISAYATVENSGDSFIADFTGFAINDAYHINTGWWGEYAGNFVGQMILQTGGDTTQINTLLQNPNALSTIHTSARNSVEQNSDPTKTRWEFGDPEFEEAYETINSEIIPNGAKFNDQTRFYHVEGQYDFKNEIQALDVLVGGQFRQYDLRSNGTIFPDGVDGTPFAGGITISEYGGFLQLTDAYADDKLKLIGSIRYDKNENFDGQVSPRISGVYTFPGNHNIRASYQTGFRNPTTQAQYIDLNVVTARLLGGLEYFHDTYQVSTNTYTIASVDEFTENVINGNPDPSILVPYTEWEPVKPEQIQVFEIGYKGLLTDRLMVDVNYYHNTYDDFITQVRVRQVQDGNGDPYNPFDPTNDPIEAQAALFGLVSGSVQNTYQIYTNNKDRVQSMGASFGLDYVFSRGYKFGMNYSWNTLDDSSLPDDFFNDYNTPEHVVNVSFGNRKVIDNLGFNIGLRWQDAFIWNSSFVQDGEVPAFSSLDAQVSYKLSSMKSILKLGGSNLLNERYITAYGSPSVGAIYYISITFDELLN
jgi:outer membrane receptor protein involved in Fe transport